MEQGDIQSLLVVPDPDAAYHVCEDFTPDCDETFIETSNQTQEIQQTVHTQYSNTSIGVEVTIFKEKIKIKTKKLKLRG